MAPNAMQQTTAPRSNQTDLPFPVAHADTVYRAISEESGRSLPVPSDEYRVPRRIRDSGVLADGWLIPDFMTDGSGVAAAIRGGSDDDALNFTLTDPEDVRGAAGTDGAANSTTTFYEQDLTSEKAARRIVRSGQFEAAVEKMAPRVRSDVNPAEAVAWAVATFARGWEAEAAIADTEGFFKGSQSNDEHGDDLGVAGSPGDYVQVKSVTFDDQRPNHIYYQWDMRGGIHYGEDYKAVAKAAAAVSDDPVVGDGRRKDTDIPSTVSFRTATNMTVGFRPHVEGKPATYRYLAW